MKEKPVYELTAEERAEEIEYLSSIQVQGEVRSQRLTDLIENRPYVAPKTPREAVDDAEPVPVPEDAADDDSDAVPGLDEFPGGDR